MLRSFALSTMAVFAFLVIAAAIWIASLPPLPFTDAKKVSTPILDRNGKLLRAFAMADGRWRLPAHAKDVDPGYL
ncbi:UNVERIFIED_CONTAM: penicillin-binding protein 1C, partial [Bacteroidetes bacterium 56_B9]